MGRLLRLGQLSARRSTALGWLPLWFGALVLALLADPARGSTPGERPNRAPANPPVLASPASNGPSLNSPASGRRALQPPASDRSRLLRIEVRGPARESASTELRGEFAGQLQRDIVDPCLGARWRLVADAAHPERPGQLILIDPGTMRMQDSIPAPAPNSQANPLSNLAALPLAKDAAAPGVRSPRLIRAGDRVAVLQETAVLRARLVAVALEPAGLGQRLRVRLIGGSEGKAGNQGAIVEVRATGAGEADWLGPESAPR